MNKIIFTLEQNSEWIAKEYYPVPGIKEVPLWYKEMKTSFAEDKTNSNEVQKSQTIKRCMPVFDAITFGYIIKLHTDIYIKKKDGVHVFEWAFDTKDTVTFHSAFQLLNYRHLDLPNGAPKLRNPWSIRTPKGFSCLFTNPLHRPKYGISILEGVVDTDKYYNPVQFPFLVDEGFEGTIEAGTPIAQVMPFRRDSFRMEIGNEEDQKNARNVEVIIKTKWINGYRHFFRSNKDYL